MAGKNSAFLSRESTASLHELVDKDDKEIPMQLQTTEVFSKTATKPARIQNHANKSAKVFGKTLNRKNLKWNLWVFEIMAKLHISPFNYMHDEGKLAVIDEDDPKSKARTKSLRLLQILNFLYMTYLLAKTISAVLQTTPKWEEIIHLTMLSMSSILLPLIGHVIHDRQPEIHVKLINSYWSTEKHENKQPKAPTEKECTCLKNIPEKGCRTVLVQHVEKTVQIEEVLEKKLEFPTEARKNRINSKDLLICVLPISMFPTIVFLPLLFLVDPKHPVLIISSVPESMRNPFVIAACIIVEMVNVLSYAASIHAQVYSTLSFISTFKKTVCMELNNIRNGTSPITNRLESGQRVVKQLRLKTSLFNICHSSNCFIFRLVNLVLAIFGGFGVVKMGITVPMHNFINLFCCASAIIVNLALFGSAYKTFALLDDLKREMVKRAMVANKALAREYRMIVKAYPSCGLKVGGFRMLERESSLIYADFITQQVTSLLIATST